MYYLEWKSRRNISNCNKSSIYFRRLAVIVEYWKYWVRNSAQYTKGWCFHLEVYWQASSRQMWMKILAQIIVPGNGMCSRKVSRPCEHQQSSNIESFSSLQKTNKIKILCIRCSVIQRMTFRIGLASCSKGLHLQIVSYLQVCVQWNCQWQWQGSVSVFQVNNYFKT